MDAQTEDRTAATAGMEMFAGVLLPKFVELPLADQLSRIADMDKFVVGHFLTIFNQGVDVVDSPDFAQAIIEWEMLTALPRIEALIGFRKAVWESNPSSLSPVKTVALEALSCNMRLLKSLQELDYTGHTVEESHDVSNISCEGQHLCFEGPFKSALKSYLDLRDHL